MFITFTTAAFVLVYEVKDGRYGDFTLPQP